MGLTRSELVESKQVFLSCHLNTCYKTLQVIKLILCGLTGKSDRTSYRSDFILLHRLSWQITKMLKATFWILNQFLFKSMFLPQSALYTHRYKCMSLSIDCVRFQGIDVFRRRDKFWHTRACNKRHIACNFVLKNWICGHVSRPECRARWEHTDR